MLVLLLMLLKLMLLKLMLLPGCLLDVEEIGAHGRYKSASKQCLRRPARTKKLSSTGACMVGSYSILCQRNGLPNLARIEDLGNVVWCLECRRWRLSVVELKAFWPKTAGVWISEPIAESIKGYSAAGSKNKWCLVGYSFR